MAKEPSPTFSRSRKWLIGFNVIFAVIAALAIVAMLNYLGTRYSKRWYLSSRTQIQLSPLTVNVIRALTNKVEVTLYYDRDEPFYGDIVDLLKQYSSHHPDLAVQMVDFVHNPGLAEQVKTKYARYLAASDKNLVIFDCQGRVKIVPGRDIVTSEYLDTSTEAERSYRRRPVAFNGELLFTSALLAVTTSEPLKAYFLEGHRERRIDDPGDGGFKTFASVLEHSYIQSASLSLFGTNVVPSDCNLLVIGGPVTEILDLELQRIEEYLNQGGRMLAMIDARSAGRATGLEKLLARWGVVVGPDLVMDPDNRGLSEHDVVISGFSRHPVSEPLLGSGLYFTVPRPVMPREAPAGGNAPNAHILAATGQNSYVNNDPTQRRAQFPVVVAVERTGVRGVAAESGATRIIVTGDSFFLSNAQIDKLSNRDFGGLAANWLLDRVFMIQGVGPKPIAEYQLVIPQKQLHTMQWILLGLMPGAVLLLGGVVWLRRRR